MMMPSTCFRLWVGCMCDVMTKCDQSRPKCLIDSTVKLYGTNQRSFVEGYLKTALIFLSFVGETWES